MVSALTGSQSIGIANHENKSYQNMIYAKCHKASKEKRISCGGKSIRKKNLYKFITVKVLFIFTREKSSINWHVSPRDSGKGHKGITSGILHTEAMSRAPALASSEERSAGVPWGPAVRTQCSYRRGLSPVPV